MTMESVLNEVNNNHQHQPHVVYNHLVASPAFQWPALQRPILEFHHLHQSYLLAEY